METVEQVLVVGLLWLGGNSWYCLCGNLLGLGSLGNRIWCVGSWGRNLTTREPPWEQNGLPPMFNIMQIAL